jgi:hypothetical protein
VKDLRVTDERYQKYQRYYSLAHLYNAGVPDEELELYRGSLTKLLNSLSWNRVIMKPVPIDPARTIFRVDLRLLDWTKNDLASWRRIVEAYPSRVPLFSTSVNLESSVPSYCLLAIPLVCSERGLL